MATTQRTGALPAAREAGPSISSTVWGQLTGGGWRKALCSPPASPTHENRFVFKCRHLGTTPDLPDKRLHADFCCMLWLGPQAMVTRGRLGESSCQTGRGVRGTKRSASPSLAVPLQGGSLSPRCCDEDNVCRHSRRTPTSVSHTRSLRLVSV